MKKKFQSLKNRLHTSSIPKRLPCRETEFEDVSLFLETKLREQMGGCMYISGVPGTGKTATVRDVVSALRDTLMVPVTSSKRKNNSQSKKLNSKNKKRKLKGSVDGAEEEEEDGDEEVMKEGNEPFRYIEVNGLTFNDPYSVYSEIYFELTGKKAPSRSAADWLERYFSSNKRSSEQMIVLVVDELDVLCTKKQTILYHLFDWPNRPHSNLVVIAIANAMDLPERVMKNRISSRLGMNRTTFQPYTHEDLTEIILSRVEGLEESFNVDAINLVTRKVSAVSGDARRALDICRKSVLICEERAGTCVEIRDVHLALKELFASNKICAIRESSEQDKIFLRSCLMEFRSCGLEEGVFGRIAQHHQDTCRFEGLFVPPLTTIQMIALKLYEQRLIFLDVRGSFMQKVIRLNVSKDDIDFGCRNQD